MRLTLPALASALLLCATPAASASIVVVTQNGITFSPQNVTIQLGDTVQWVWNDHTHTVTEGTDGTIDGNELFHSDLSPSTPTFSVTFDAALVRANPRPGGLYDYFCQIHFPFMSGTVTIADPGTTYCAGDGTGTACPCGNTSASATEGCLHSLGTGGSLAGAGTSSVTSDDAHLLGSLMPNSSALYFQGVTRVAGGAGAVFGDGLRCVGGSVVRLGIKTNVNGASSYPVGADLPISVRGALVAGDVRHYQIWFRNSASFCTPSTFNLTNGYTLTWGP